MTYLIGRFDPPSRTCQREIGILIKGSTWSDCEREINEWLSVRYARTIERLTGPPQRPICSWSTCANVLRVMKALQMFQFHWYSKQAGHHSSQYENKIPRRGYSDIVVLWNVFFEEIILINFHAPLVQIGFACHRKRLQGGVQVDAPQRRLCQFYRDKRRRDDASSLDSSSLYDR